MDEIVTCPGCHIVVKATDYFCFNCGKNLHLSPPSLSIDALALLYIGSALLPPMGIYWGWKYLTSSDPKRKLAGYIAFGITIIAFLITIKITMNFMDSINKQMNQYQSLGL